LPSRSRVDALRALREKKSGNASNSREKDYNVVNHRCWFAAAMDRELVAGHDALARKELPAPAGGHQSRL
jgi:hypothetical protein